MYVPCKATKLDKARGDPARKGKENPPEQFLPSCLSPQNWNEGKKNI